MQLLVGHSPRETEVAQLHLTLHVHQNVRGFDVAVHNICAVQELYCAESIIQNGYYMLLIEFNILGRVEHLLEVRINVLHHDEDVAHLV